jgi:hypothetical protein
MLQKAAEKDKLGVTRAPMIKALQLFDQIKRIRWDTTLQASIMKQIHYGGYVAKTYTMHRY